MSLLLNHVVSFAKVHDIDEYIATYEQAGFWVHNNAVRHEPGKRNRFIYIGTEYLELCWIEDKQKFQKEASEQEKYYSSNPAPYGLAFEVRNLAKFRQKKIRQGFRLSSIWSKTLASQAENPWWSFLNFSRKDVPGLWTFALTYLQRDWTKSREVRIGKNTIFGITGITVVTKRPKTRAYTWGRFFDFKVQKLDRGYYGGKLGIHQLEWITPWAFKKNYKMNTICNTPKKGYDEIRLIHLVAKDLKTAKLMLQKAKFHTETIEDTLLVYPNKEDGYAFSIRTGSQNKWKEDRENWGIKFSDNS